MLKKDKALCIRAIDYFETSQIVTFFTRDTGKISAIAKGEETDYGDTYFMTQPRFETGDPRYQWLNRIVAVAEGRVLPNAVEYHVYQLVNG